MAEKPEGGIFRSLADSLSSLKLAITFLIILAVASISGTVIPQNLSPEEYLRIYSVSTYRILRILGFLDVFRSGWFIALLSLFSLNLMVCSLKRLRAIWPFLARPERILDDPKWTALSNRRQFHVSAALHDSSSTMEKVLSKTLGRPKRSEESSRRHFFAEKGKLSRLGVYGVHLSILLILAGALIGSLYGFRGYVNIEEGQMADRIVLQGKRRVEPLGFAVRLNQFQVSFYPNGSPKEFKSTVSIVNGGREVLQEAIRVNHPLTYRGISFYQSSYGVAGVDRAVLTVKERNSGKTLSVTSPIGERTEIPGSGSFLILTRFQEDFQGLGPALQAILFEPNRPPENFWVFENHPELEEKRPGRYQFAVQEITPRYYSGLQVTKDPGVWVVWTGCFLMMAGFFMVFFLSHRRVWVRLTGEERGTRVEIGGLSHRNRLAFEKEIDKMEETFKAMLSQGKP